MDEDRWQKIAWNCNPPKQSVGGGAKRHWKDDLKMVQALRYAVRK
jgi:hypothetical protein